MRQEGWIEEKLFSKIRELMPIATVDILTVYKGKVLLMLRNNDPAKGVWFPPGGRVRYGETLEQTVHRKLEEETGLIATKIEKKGVMSHFYPQTHIITTFFRANVADEKIKMNDEHSNYKWISKIEDNLHPYVKHMIKESEIFTTKTKRDRIKS